MTFVGEIPVVVSSNVDSLLVSELYFTVDLFSGKNIC